MENINKKSNTALLSKQVRISKDNYSFDPNSSKWILNKDTIISFQTEVLAIEPTTLYGFKLSLARYAEELSAWHTNNMYQKFQRMIRDMGCKTIDVSTIRNWKVKLGKDKLWYLGSLRGFLISWYDYGYKGISEDVVNALEKMTLPGNEKGKAIANRCEWTGAFTQNEQVAVAEELIRLYRENEISLPCYAYLNVVQATARRPKQIGQLKVKDILKEYDSKNHAYNFYLNIPRIKQRGVGFRGEFKKLAITEELYAILCNLVRQELKALEKALQTNMTDEQIGLMPIFFDWLMLKKIRKNFSANFTLDNYLSTDTLHLSTNDLNHKFMRRVTKLNRAISERTGEYIQLTARRFRRTRGTNLGRKGVSPFIVAEALDHSDTQNINVYIENTADTVTYIDKAMGKILAPFAKAFKGKIIDKFADGERGDDRTARIPDKDNEVVGACGTNDFCVKGYEACYLCEKFRPLLDAPHEKFLEHLYEEKERRLKETQSEQYASTKDTLILAVEWVVQACNERKLGQDEHSHE